MKIFTSYYANIKNIPDDYILVSISGGLTKEIENSIDYWDKYFAPSLDIFTEFKKSELPNKEEIYVRRFKDEVLGNRDINEILKSWTDKFGKDKKYVMLCYETPEDFCHRQIVAEAIENKYGIEVNEIGIDNNYVRKDFKFKIKENFDEDEW